MSGEVVSVKELYFKYNSTEVLTNVSFQLHAGDYAGLVGPNGSGKSTLTKLILGLYAPYRGNVLLFGKKPSEFQDWFRVGYLPQRVTHFNPYFPATVREVVALGLLSRKGFPKKISKSDEIAIERALSLVDIVSIKDERIGTLSGGQQQRVLLAKALVNEPDLLVLDEPTTALDPEVRDRFFTMLKALNKERKVTVIIVTHDIGTIGQYASRLLYLDKRLIFYGGFDDFCVSHDMSDYFGEFAQHIICHRHDLVKNRE